MDVVLSAVLLLLSLPVLLLSALIIGISSPGPVLFRQERMGRGFRPFRILKLRTMAHAAPGSAYTLGADPRITPFGRWLRRWKVDELPQLWNVLRGDMSLVGPRPVVPELIREFRFHYAALLRERPGLTDPASLKYCQEASLMAAMPEAEAQRFFKSVVTPDKLRISMRYMEESDVWTDLGTLGMTVAVCCFPALGGIYGERRRLEDCPPELRGVDHLSVERARALDSVLRVPQAPTFAAKLHEGKSRVAPKPPRETERVFAPELALIEAMAEEHGHIALQPWILKKIRDFGEQSTASGRDRSA